MARIEMTGPDTFRYVEERNRDYLDRATPRPVEPDWEDIIRRGGARAIRQEAFPGVEQFSDTRFEDYNPEEYAPLLTGRQPSENAPPLRVTPIATPGSLIRHQVRNQYNLTPQAEEEFGNTNLRMWPKGNYTEIGEGTGGNYGNGTIRMWLPKQPTTEGTGGAPGVLVHELAHHMHEKYLTPRQKMGLYRAQQPIGMGPLTTFYGEPWEQADRFEREYQQTPDSAHYGFSPMSLSNEIYATTAQMMKGDMPSRLPENLRPYYQPMFRDVPQPQPPTSDRLRQYLPWTPAPYGMDQYGNRG